MLPLQNSTLHTCLYIICIILFIVLVISPVQSLVQILTMLCCLGSDYLTKIQLINFVV